MKIFHLSFAATAFIKSGVNALFRGETPRDVEIISRRQLMGGSMGGGGGGGDSGGSCAAGGEVALDCDPDANGKKDQSCCEGLSCKSNWCNYALEGYAASECGGPTYPTHCAPGLVCGSEGLCTAPSSPPSVTPLSISCSDWCLHEDILGWYANNPLDSYTASDYTFDPNCSSSTGCPCTLSAMIANTWTIVTGNICDSHNFNDNCGSCDGTQCDAMQATIFSQWDSVAGICTCSATANGITKDVWDSNCAENDYFPVIFTDV